LNCSTTALFRKIALWNSQGAVNELVDLRFCTAWPPQSRASNHFHSEVACLIAKAVSGQQFLSIPCILAAQSWQQHLVQGGRPWNPAAGVLKLKQQQAWMSIHWLLMFSRDLSPKS